MADKEQEGTSVDPSTSMKEMMLAFHQLLKQQQETQKLFQEQQAENQKLMLQQRTNQISTPQIAPFDVTKKNRWEDWLKVFRRCEYFLEATTDVQRINKLVVAMGVEAAAEFHKLRLGTEEATKFETVVAAALTKHFVGEQTLVYRRYMFNRRNQQPGETAKQFVTEARILIEKCKYASMTDPESELLRDRLVCGITDQPLREALLADSKLTLEKVLTKIDAREQSHLENVAMGGAATSGNGIEPALVERITQGASRVSSGGWRNSQQSATAIRGERKNSSQTKNEAANSGNRCFSCGAVPYNIAHRERCPARSIKCNNCRVTGHFAKWCRRAKKVQAVQENLHEQTNEVSSEPLASEQTGHSMFYIDRVISQVQAGNEFIGQIRFNNTIIRAKFDSGADVSIIPSRMVPPDLVIQSSSKKLCGAAGKPLCVEGFVDIPLANNKSSISERFYIIRDQEQLLIGAPALRQLGILQISEWSRIQCVDSETERKRWEERFPRLFEKRLGKIPYEYAIEITNDAVPYSVPVARNVAIPLRPAVEAELRRMLKEGVIEKVVKPTSWCAPMVVAKKRDNNVRICTDFTRLNQFVRRPRTMLPDVEYSLAAIGRSKVFTKLDAASGFWQVPLEVKCRDLTTFITPMGRFRYRRLPFGITSAPEFFQAAMSSLLSGLEGTVCHMDDVVIHGKTLREHDERLEAVLTRMSESGLVLNPQKCAFRTNKIRFLGQVIEGENVKPDPERLKALSEFPRPKTVTGVRKLMGTLNQLAKFIPRLAELTEPIRRLLKKGACIRWDAPQQEALDRIIDEVQRTTSLIRYDVQARTAIVTDASNVGIGAVLMQMDASQNWQPVSFASRTLIPAEVNYAPIEKEALGITWAVEKFRVYLEGKKFEVFTDHQPLISLFGSKDLASIPLRVQRFKIRLLPYVFSITHVPGKEIHIADFLSRHPLPYSNDDLARSTETEVDTHAIFEATTPVSAIRREEIRAAQARDTECLVIREMLKKGWPKYATKVPSVIKGWFTYRSEINGIDSILHHNNRIVIPRELRPALCRIAHDGHLGITKCVSRARTAMFWPGMTRDIEGMIERCSECAQNQKPRRAPLMWHSECEYAWQKIGMDIFFHGNRNYLIWVDYYLTWIEIAEITQISSEAVIRATKNLIARFGVPEIVVSDAGTQFTSSAWSQFATQFGFRIVTSSPMYHRSNGMAERAVQTIKSLLNKNNDVALALMTLRASPNAMGYSPAQLFLGRNIRTRLPAEMKRMTENDYEIFAERRGRAREEERIAYNKKHRVRVPHEFGKGERVYVPDLTRYGVIEDAAQQPRSWFIRTDTGRVVQRNAHDINKIPDSETCDTKVPLSEFSCKTKQQHYPLLDDDDEEENPGDQRICSSCRESTSPFRGFEQPPSASNIQPIPVEVKVGCSSRPESSATDNTKYAFKSKAKPKAGCSSGVTVQRPQRTRKPNPKYCD